MKKTIPGIIAIMILTIFTTSCRNSTKPSSPGGRWAGQQYLVWAGKARGRHREKYLPGQDEAHLAG